MARITIVIPTLGRHDKLRRVLSRLELQVASFESFEVTVVADASESDPSALDKTLAGRPYAARRFQASKPGASAARNLGWSRATTPLIFFLDDDVLPERNLVSEHLAWHDLYPDHTVGVLGRVRWADELRVTPFMRWLEQGIQFDFDRIEGIEAGWGRFFTANASVKRVLLDRAGGFDEDRLPFGYEDLDLGLRLNGQGFRLLYNRAASAEHLHPMDLALWRKRVTRIAVAERQFTRVHPEIPPYFFNLFSDAASRPPARGRSARLAAFVPPRTPWLGPRVWGSADIVYRQALAEPFLAAWDSAGDTAR